MYTYIVCGTTGIGNLVWSVCLDHTRFIIKQRKQGEPLSFFEWDLNSNDKEKTEGMRRPFSPNITSKLG
jgi:hypothetical protein